MEFPILKSIFKTSLYTNCKCLKSFKKFKEGEEYAIRQLKDKEFGKNYLRFYYEDGLESFLDLERETCELVFKYPQEYINHLNEQKFHRNKRINRCI